MSVVNSQDPEMQKWLARHSSADDEAVADVRIIMSTIRNGQAFVHRLIDMIQTSILSNAALPESILSERSAADQPQVGPNAQIPAILNPNPTNVGKTV